MSDSNTSDASAKKSTATRNVIIAVGIMLVLYSIYCYVTEPMAGEGAVYVQGPNDRYPVKQSKGLLQNFSVSGAMDSIWTAVGVTPNSSRVWGNKVENFSIRDINKSDDSDCIGTFDCVYKQKTRW